MNIEIPQNKYKNLNREERSALYNFKNDKNIVIKSADKGSSVVVWDRDDYIKEAEERLGEIPDLLSVTYMRQLKNSEKRRPECRHN